MNGATRYVTSTVFPAALSMLPEKMDSPAARAFLCAIGLQESRFEYRRQINGPARGFWQFEINGVMGVFSHDASRPHIAKVMQAMGYEHSAAIHEALADNDILACVEARLLIWTSPLPLPKRDDAHGAWQQYISGWRPGKPHPGTWDVFYAQAWQIVGEPEHG